MRLHIKHVGEDYAGVSFSFGKAKQKMYAEVSLSDMRVLQGLEKIAKAVLEKYPDNKDYD